MKLAKMIKRIRIGVSDIIFKILSVIVMSARNLTTGRAIHQGTDALDFIFSQCCSLGEIVIAYVSSKVDTCPNTSS